jgi:hypothetical protein
MTPAFDQLFSVATPAQKRKGRCRAAAFDKPLLDFPASHRRSSLRLGKI